MSRSRVLLIPALFCLSACLSGQAPAPFTNYGAGMGQGSAGVHTVSEGETLWTISQRYHMEMRDIAKINRLSPPFYIPPGTRLRLPPPLEYRVRNGDTIYQVSRMFNANQSDIARLNNLAAPYKLEPGAVLRMPSPPVPEPVSIMASAPVAPTPQAMPLEPVAPYQPPGTISREVLKAPNEPPPQQQQQRIASAPPQTLHAPQMLQKPPPQHAPQPPQPTPTPAKVQQVKAVKQKITAETPKRASSKFLRPVNGRVVSGYGPTKDGMHNDGINIRAPKGTPIEAAENGVVVYAGNELKGSGNLVLIRHEGRWMTAYAHMDSMKINRGDIVKRGQVIGTVGNTGSVTEPQLHFEVRRGTEAINPERFIEG